MPWFRIDDGFSTSKPVLRIPRRARASAIGLWTLAGAWSAKELTDGHIASHLLEEFASTPAMARQLVDCGLWEMAEDGWNFRHWTKYQPTREQVLEDREREAERKRKYRESKRSPKGTPTGQTQGHQAESGHPDPTRPDPTRPVSTDVDTNVPADADAHNASTLIAEWIDHCDSRPPGRVIGQVSKEIKTMLTEGIAYERVRSGLAEWNRKGLHPSTLASVVHELGNKSTRPATNKADERMRANLAVVDELRAMEQQQQPINLRAIEGNR